MKKILLSLLLPLSVIATPLKVQLDIYTQSYCTGNINQCNFSFEDTSLENCTNLANRDTWQANQIINRSLNGQLDPALGITYCYGINFTDKQHPESIYVPRFVKLVPKADKSDFDLISDISLDDSLALSYYNMQDYYSLVRITNLIPFSNKASDLVTENINVAGY